MQIQTSQWLVLWLNSVYLDALEVSGDENGFLGGECL